MRKIRFGVVGLRNIGQGHIRKIKECTDAELVAVADTQPERIAQVCERFGNVRGYSDAQALFDSPEVDAVVLAVPNRAHAPLSIAALEAGKHVLVEKPIASTTREAQQMIETRDRTACVLMVGMNQRFCNHAHTIKKAIATGLIGTPYHTHARWVRRLLFAGIWQRGDWFLKPETSGGGPLLDIGYHKLDLALHLLGFPRIESVTGVCTFGLGKRVAAAQGRSYEIEDFAYALLRYDRSRTIVLEASFSS